MSELIVTYSQYIDFSNFLFLAPQILLYYDGRINMFVKSADAWNSIVAKFRSSIQVSQRAVKQRHMRLVHLWKFPPRRSFIPRKMMTLLTNSTGAQVRTQLILEFEQVLLFLI